MTQRAIDGPYIYFVTANVQDRRWSFVKPDRAAMLGQAVQTCCRMKNFDLLAYCILPNHVHLLVRKLTADEVASIEPGAAESPQRTLRSVRCGESSRQHQATYLFPHRRLPSRRCGGAHTRFTLSDLMHSIKSTFSQHLHQGKFWQHRSNFRIIESDQRLENTINYIIHNYKKMNLDERYGMSPFVFVDWDALGSRRKQERKRLEAGA